MTILLDLSFENSRFFFDKGHNFCSRNRFFLFFIEHSFIQYSELLGQASRFDSKLVSKYYALEMISTNTG